ncbi:MAG: ATP-binding cassette domain-containing protein [Candidatus Amulumruptor caecigallinarius]|nr:ATP-binding cassette domain-containing protein [Candidatus Amulumruptor caecigallinarius]MCM1397609.1 ATP-binding cassette domain-containing protein [Candidatus Amulumruptor caecigallinarius]MCM1454608.1 ATP-binding cassette domain-containing protein [bacterium]
MQRINTITLTKSLPRVFRGEETSEAISRSQIWLTEVEFRRPGFYLVSAESGTGKSSMCSFIYGDRTDYDGTISFNGRDVATISTEEWCELRRSHLAYLPQEMRLFPELSVMDNLQLKNGLTDRYSEAELIRMLEALEIEGKRDEPAGRLSVGQQQRVAIIRAIAQPFDYLLLDEPVSHLDARNNDAAAGLIASAVLEAEGAVIATSVGNHINLPFTHTIAL